METYDSNGNFIEPDLEINYCEHGIENCVYCGEFDINSSEIEQGFIEYHESIENYFTDERSKYFEAGARWILNKITEKS